MFSLIKSDIRRYLHLSRYALRYKKGWGLIVFLTLASSALSVLQPWSMKILVDNVLSGNPLPKGLEAVAGGASAQELLAGVVLAGLIFFAIGSGIEVALTFAWIKVGQGMVYDLAGDLFAHIQRQSLLFHSRQPVGDSISRITGDSWCVHNIVDTLLFGPAQAALTIILMLTVMFQMDAGLTTLALCAIPLALTARVLMKKRIRTAARARREVESRIQSHVQQTLSGLSVVQAFAQEERAQRGFWEIANSIVRAQRNTILIKSVANLSSGFLVKVGTALVLLVGARRVLSGQVSVGTLLVFLVYLRTLQAQMNSIAGLLGALQGTSAGVERVMEVLEREPEVRERAGAVALDRARGLVRLDDVWFGYDEGRAVLRGVSLEARPGQAIAIVGATGAGKSTLVSLIPRLFDPWRGSVSIDGHDLRDLKLGSLRRQVSVVLQEPFLFPVSVADNIAYGRPEATREEVERAARAANADDFIGRLEGGYDAVVGERGATLSGGERQRLAIARAVLKDAPVLILDEPTSALDAETEREVMEALGRLMQGRTTFIIAHRLSTARRADRILVLEGGRVVESGTHDELLARRKLYARMHNLQFGNTAATRR